MKEDLDIVTTSLHFINDLLRNMLDMNRANSNQLHLDMKHVDIKRDILQPVAVMLYSRGSDFRVIVECEPDHLVIMADKLRLKQIVLNLSRNSCKFVEKGYVKLRAAVVSPPQDKEEGGREEVCIFVEDSGPGIPIEKRTNLFSKFQESLDSLHQGTGIGLAVCRRLIDLMGGDIVLDESFDSGVPGCPGSRLVIQLDQRPLCLEEDHDVFAKQEQLETNGSPSESDLATGTSSILAPGDMEQSALPQNLRVLFVDDDLILRRLFQRSVQKLMPNWEIEEASNGETALSIASEQDFDLIFVDQYMSSVSKQLLGTETARALRAQGFDKHICGLSANDMENQFLKSGANAFIIKPLPCGRDALEKELKRVLFHGQ